ncbi:hypothetical protein UPYG_G00119650 [Umbra pygmaea]|uniref:MICOS complex subunit n=1 Tax=Umbra pygmaea TaxID=75934 RepID=A0ABD0X839_UMBPY
MAATVVKLAAIPAAIGLASIRVYAMSEDKSESVLLSPRELSIYARDPCTMPCLDEQPGALESGLGVVRVGLQPYVRTVKNAYTSVKVGAVTVYTAGQDTYEFLRSPPPGFIPRVSVITVSGLAGLILARKGSHLKRLGVPLGMATLGTAVCYPTQTVGVVKVTGQKMYAASQYTTSSLVSLFKSKQKEVNLQTVSVEQAPHTLILEPDVNEAKPLSEAAISDAAAPAVDQAPTSEPRHTLVPVEEEPPSKTEPVPHSSTMLTPAERSVDHEPSAATGEEEAVESVPVEEDVPMTMEDDVPAADKAAEADSSPAHVEEVVSVPCPLSGEAAADEIEPVAEEATPLPVPVEEATPLPVPVEEATPLPVPVEEATPLPVPVEEATPLPVPVEEATPLPVPVEEATPLPVPVEEATPLPVPVEEATPLPAPGVLSAPPPAPVEKESSVIVMKTAGKPKFAADPKLVDLGQSSPEDEDLYSKRG